MVFKIEKPESISRVDCFYLVHNKNKDIMFNDIVIGDFPGLDILFDKDSSSIYVEGYIDKKDRFIIKRKLENQKW